MSLTNTERLLHVQVSEVHGRGLFARKAIPAASVITEVSGELTRVRSRRSMQIGHDLHLETSSPVRYLNHSCQPSCTLRLDAADTLTLVALGELRAGDELTVDYATFELERPTGLTPCRCGGTECRGTLSGYRDLTRVRRAELAPLVLPYLAAWGECSAGSG